MSGKPIVKAVLTKREKKTLQIWMKKQNSKVAQKRYHDFPYYCPNGGDYTYMVTPTCIGRIIEVKNNVTEEQIDITDYGAW